MSVKAAPTTDPREEVIARRGAIALMVIALCEALVGFLVPAANGIFALVSGTHALLFAPPWWAFAIIPIALGVTLTLTYPTSRHYLNMKRGVRLFNSPFAVASFALLWVVVSLWGTGSYAVPAPGLYGIAAVLALGVAVVGGVIDSRQDGTIPFLVRGLTLSFGRKNRENRRRGERQAAEAYDKIPSSARLPVFTKAGRWAIAPAATLLVTAILLVAKVVTPFYVLLGLIGLVTTGLFFVVILHNAYARRTGIYLDLPTPYVGLNSFHYLSSEIRKTYSLRDSGLKVGILSGFVDLAAFAISAAVWLGAVFLWAPLT